MDFSQQFALPMEHMREEIEAVMPSLFKMPTAARQLVNNVFSFLSSSTPQTSATEKTVFSTPQVDRKKMNGIRRMSDTPQLAALSKVYHNNVDKIETWEPNVYEKELLRRTWSDEFDFLYELGSAIYCYIFEHNPNCKKLFPFIAKYEGEKWKESKEFRGQALKFVQTLSQAIKNLYHMDRLAPYLYGIGQRHCKFANRGFKHEYWDIFQDAMEHSLEHRIGNLKELDADQKRDAITVWRTLALYTTVHMRAGFLDGLNDINKHPPLA